jgi:hypothetical protein
MYFHQGGTYYNNGALHALTGNDITWDKYEEIKDFVDAGMPLIITQDVADAYYEATNADGTKNYKQHKLDPGSNMYLLLETYLKDKTPSQNTNGDWSYPTTKPENVLAGFDPTDQIKLPNSGDYGLTYGGFVPVFGGIDDEAYVDSGNGNVLTPIKKSTVSVNAEELSAMLRNPKGQRPKFTLIQSPALYVEGDASTEITGNKLTFKFDIAAGKTYQINAYIDDNTNSRFEDNEKLKLKISGNTATATIANGFDGPLYWKFEVVSGDCKSSITGISKVHIKEPNKVRVLQIAPEVSATGGDNGKTMLLFCTECQQYKGILKGNRKADGNGKYDDYVRQTASHFNDTNDYSVSSYSSLAVANPATYDRNYKDGSGSHQLGVHQHNFGIVKYDANLYLGQTKGSDDWTTNWMYDLINDYDVDLDIWTTRDFENVVKDATTKVTSANAADVIDKYKNLASVYETYYLTMKAIINGEANPNSASFIHLKNKLTSTENVFNETDVNGLFGLEAGSYQYETAQGGFHVTDAEFYSYLSAQENLDSYLAALDKKQNGLKSASKENVSKEIEYETTYKRYSDFYSIANAMESEKYTVKYTKKTADTTGKITSTTQTSAEVVLDEFSQLFAPWRNAKIYEQYFYKMYRKYQLYSTMKEVDGVYIPDLNACFDCIVIGVAESFGDDDIKDKNSPNAMPTLKSYVENGGHTFIFHQTINASGSTENMTNNLITLFGQNYSHMKTKTIVETGISYQVLCRYENGTETLVDQGTLKEGEGLNVDVGFVADGNAHFGNATAAPNATGNLVINWSTKNGSGAPSTANHYHESVKIKINGNDFREFKPNTQTENHGTYTENLGSPTPQTVTRVVNESDSDTNRYKYTPLLNDGTTLGLAARHETYYGASDVLSQNAYDNWLTYTQGGYMVRDCDVQADHVNFDYVNMFQQGKVFTNYATQTNTGVVTLYPFLIGSRLQISGTHPNSFSTDIENKDVVVYYALAGGVSGTQSANVASDPQDGIDNYFIYSYGNVTYCGAGHSLLTGKSKDNNDERRLFINVILNAGKKSVFGPTIEVYDPYPTEEEDGKLKYTQNDVKYNADNGTYEMVVTGKTDVPEFTYKVDVPDAADDVDSVKIYYDLTANRSGDDYGFVKNEDVLIFEANSKNDKTILKDLYKQILNNTAIHVKDSSGNDIPRKDADGNIMRDKNGNILYESKLQLKESYFIEPYDYKYTYIVIAVKTKKGVVTMERIMVKLAPKLWDMT